MKRIYTILFLGQLLIAGLYIINMQRAKLQESYRIGKMLELKEEKLIQMDKEIYLVEKLKNPKNLLKKAAETGLNERPADEVYFHNVYVNPTERIEKVKAFHEKQGEKWKAQMAESDTFTDIED
jgi:hypothetical protein